MAIRYVEHQGIGMVLHGIAGFLVLFMSYVSNFPYLMFWL